MAIAFVAVVVVIVVDGSGVKWALLSIQSSSLVVVLMVRVKVLIESTCCLRSTTITMPVNLCFERQRMQPKMMQIVLEGMAVVGRALVVVALNPSLVMFKRYAIFRSLGDPGRALMLLDSPCRGWQ